MLTDTIGSITTLSRFKIIDFSSDFLRMGVVTSSGSTSTTHLFCYDTKAKKIYPSKGIIGEAIFSNLVAEKELLLLINIKKEIQIFEIKRVRYDKDQEYLKLGLNTLPRNEIGSVLKTQITGNGLLDGKIENPYFIAFQCRNSRIYPSLSKNTLDQKETFMICWPSGKCLLKTKNNTTSLDFSREGSVFRDVIYAPHRRFKSGKEEGCFVVYDDKPKEERLLMISNDGKYSEEFYLSDLIQNREHKNENERRGGFLRVWENYGGILVRVSPDQLVLVFQKEQEDEGNKTTETQIKIYWTRKMFGKEEKWIIKDFSALNLDLSDEFGMSVLTVEGDLIYNVIKDRYKGEPPKKESKEKKLGFSGLSRLKFRRKEKFELPTLPKYDITKIPLDKDEICTQLSHTRLFERNLDICIQVVLKKGNNLMLSRLMIYTFNKTHLSQQLKAIKKQN